MLGQLDEDVARSLVRRHPGVRFRMHANVWVEGRRRITDLCTFGRDRAWFTAAARVHRALGAAVYSAHAGLRCLAGLSALFDNARACADLFGSPVAIEGQYPTDDSRWLLSTWAEYAALLASGLPMAVDLSHLNILAVRSGRLERGLVAELLASSACLEIHVSANDGSRDAHAACGAFAAPWWLELLASANPAAVVFTEGRLLQRAAGAARGGFVVSGGVDREVAYG